MTLNRRSFLKHSSRSTLGLAASSVLGHPRFSSKADSAEEWNQDQLDAAGVVVEFPTGRVPLTFIIDDSTCLVNMAHFCMPQFAAAWPNRQDYRKPWRDWPREIPDAFVREFGVWCAEHGVKGKYSIVPNPACVGWLDRELPGWSRAELRESLGLVRELLMPNWDIHPEMITHTRVVDLATGRPKEPVNASTMENWFPQERRSADEMAEYIAYALRIVQNCELPCSGITTPGGFGNLVKPELSLGAKQALDDVFHPEIPHYFKYVITDESSTEPRLENVVRDGDRVELIVNIPAGTGDWFGGWDGTRPVEGDRYANDDATQGRMVELIERNQPAFMLCHWPGLYNNGSREGFHAFQRIVSALDQRFGDRTIWMKLSEIARYWATKGTVEIERRDNQLVLKSAFDCPAFTFRVKDLQPRSISVRQARTTVSLSQVDSRSQLRHGAWTVEQQDCLACVDVAKGRNIVQIAASA